VVVWHRNHLGILSSQALTLNGIVYSYDFSDDVSKVYGGTSGHVELSPGIWGMMTGDGNSDGHVDDLDNSGTWKTQAGKSGYLNGDYNLNTQVDNTDKNMLWIPNRGKNTQVPE